MNKLLEEIYSFTMVSLEDEFLREKTIQDSVASDCAAGSYSVQQFRSFKNECVG